MFAMADIQLRASGSRRWLALFAALLILSLAAHYAADTTRWSPDLDRTCLCGSSASGNAASDRPTVLGLHSGATLPAATPIHLLATLAFAVPVAAALHRSWRCPPPARPPIAA